MTDINQTLPVTRCAIHGCTQLHDNWPGHDCEGLLCQDHWEEYSSRLWWEQLYHLGQLGGVRAEA